MDDYLVTWSEPINKWQDEQKSERFINVPEIYVDGYVDGLKRAGKKKVYKDTI